MSDFSSPSSAPTSHITDFKGQPAVLLHAPNGAQATILLHGAQVVSWIPAGDEERLYLSETAKFGDGSAVRGGVPVIFPQFELLGPLPRHGFARTMTWQLIDARTGSDYALAILRLMDTPETRAIWPHPFILELTVSISGERLDMELDVENIGDETIRFAAALHTYLRVRELEEVALEGLRGQRYMDRLNGDKVITDSAVTLSISDQINRIYYDTQNPLLLREPGRALGIHSENLPDTVVWNPWENGSKAIADMPANGFRRMLCVEAAAIEKPVEVAPQMSWWGRQTLVALG